MGMLEVGNTIATMRYGGGSIMPWGCFATGGTVELHKIDGKEFKTLA